MRVCGRRSALGLVAVLAGGLALCAWADSDYKDLSLDKPLVLNQDLDYTLSNVHIAGLRDTAALMLTGRINSVTINRSTFGAVRVGANGKAAAVECAGASVGRIIATDSEFYDAENQLVSLREGSFTHVRFQRCTFRASESFLKQVYASNPWRDWPPVTEFYNIDRLELLDNQFSNTTIVIHPSVKQVVLRGQIPGLVVQDKHSTQVIRLRPGQEPARIAAPPGPVAAAR